MDNIEIFLELPKGTNNKVLILDSSSWMRLKTLNICQSDLDDGDSFLTSKFYDNLLQQLDYDPEGEERRPDNTSESKKKEKRGRGRPKCQGNKRSAANARDGE